MPSRAPVARIGALAALGIVVCLAPELMGGHPAPAAIAIAILASLAAIAAQLAFGRHAPRVREPVIIAALAAAALVALQATPLPIDVVRSIAPAAADAADRSAALVEAPAPTTATISLAPLATRRELAEGLAMLAIFVAAWSMSAYGDRLTVVRIAAVSIALVSAVVLTHSVLDLRQPFGFMEEPWWHPTLIGPLLNANHLAGLLGAGVPLLLACGIESDAPQARWPWFVAAGVAAVTTLVAGSRGGVLSLAVGVIALVALMRWRRGVGPRTSILLWGSALIAIVGTATFSVVGGAMIEETRRDGLPKLDTFVQALDLIPQAPWLGVGRGAFSAAFVRLQGTFERAEHPENLEIEWITELGVPCGLFLLGSLALALFRAVRTARSASQVGAIAAVVSLVVHDQFDFALEMIGIGVVAAALLGAAVAPSSSAKPRAEGAGRDPRLGPAVVGAIGLVATALVAFSVIDLAVPRLQGQALDAARARDWGRVDALGRTGITAHPSEPVFPLLAGYSATMQDRPDALRWLNRAMVLAPNWHEPHHFAARWLARHGAVEQAWLEVQHVKRLGGPGYAQPAACAVALRAGSSTAATRVFARDLEVIEALLQCPGIAAEDAAALDAFLAGEGRPGPIVRRARAALAAQHGEEALALLDAFEGEDAQIVVARADALLALGRHPLAIELLEAEVQRSPTSPMLERLARAHADARDAEGMRSTVQRLSDASPSTAASLAANRLFLAQLEQSMGNHGHALRALEEARNLDPSGPALERIEQLATLMGNGRRAGLARSELCRRDGPTSSWCVRTEDERSAVPAQLPSSP